jgi:hypothetical protein
MEDVGGKGNRMGATLPRARVWGGGESGRLGRALAMRKDEGNPHALTFGARVGVGDKGECWWRGTTPSRAWGERGDSEGKRKKGTPCARVWGEGEGGRRGKVLVAKKNKGNAHALTFGVRVGVGDERVGWQREKMREMPTCSCLGRLGGHGQ